MAGEGMETAMQAHERDMRCDRRRFAAHHIARAIFAVHLWVAGYIEAVGERASEVAGLIFLAAWLTGQ